MHLLDLLALNWRRSYFSQTNRKSLLHAIMITEYHAKYFAHELIRQHGSDGVDRLSMALFDACVDLNPHQIEAALFALRSPISKGVVLADEVGLGKAIEAGLVLCQYWAERKRKLLIICPASLRKQWSLELQEKFNIPNVVLDARIYKLAQKAGNPNPFATDGVVVTSLNFASTMRAEIRAVYWDLVVIDEAHKLRNAYRPSNKMGQNIKWAIEDRKKLLLTATPLQNTLMELYGLSTVIDDMIFGDPSSFRSQYATVGTDRRTCETGFSRSANGRLGGKSSSMSSTRNAARSPSDSVPPMTSKSSMKRSRNTSWRKYFALPKRQRHLTTLILRKLLASSSYAVASTLEKMRARLEQLRQGEPVAEALAEELIEDEEIEEDLLDEILSDETEEPPREESKIDTQALESEIAELTRYSQWARSIGIDTKSRSLLKALGIGFGRMDEMGANRRALVFTESRRTQDYLKNFLESNGYAGKIILFNGTNADPESRQIIDRWCRENAGTGRATSSRAIDGRTALIEHFRDQGTVMIATEAAAEGVNLQFCSLVINYDLPWNPQRIEQRIGRCHRYGQKHDVVVVNFLNDRNEADQRVHELLAEKFNLFNGVFGASDEVLGSIESGVDFERRISAIYQECRTPEAINAAFRQLQQEMDETIKARLDDTRRMLMEHFDEDVHARLKMRLDDTKANLDRIGRMFWSLSKFVLRDHAQFDDNALSFYLSRSPHDGQRLGRYHLISKTQPNVPGDFLYRLSHPLGEWVLETGKTEPVTVADVRFDLTSYPLKLSMVESIKGQGGWLTLQHVAIDSFDREDYLLFSAFTDAGRSLDQETCERLFHCGATVKPIDGVGSEVTDRLSKETARHAEAAVARSLESNNKLFQEERERLEKWADDMVIAAEKDLRDTKEQIKGLKRQARLVVTLDEQNDLQMKLQELERKQRRQRQEIFDIEDQIAEKRDRLIDGLQRRMSQKTTSEPLFTIRWEVV